MHRASRIFWGVFFDPWRDWVIVNFTVDFGRDYLKKCVIFEHRSKKEKKIQTIFIIFNVVDFKVLHEIVWEA